MTVGETKRESRRAHPRILLVDPDPYLAFVIQQDLPTAEITEVGSLSSPEELDRIGADLVVVSLGHRSARRILESRSPSTRVIGVIQGRSIAPADRPDSLDGLLMTPFVQGEVARVVRGVLDLPLPSEETRESVLTRAARWFGPARIAAVVAAAFLEISSDPGVLERAILIAAFVYVSARSLHRKTGPVVTAADVGVSTILLASTGGISSAYVLLGLVAALQAGVVLGLRTGLMSGALIAMGSFVEVIQQVRAGSAPARELIAWLVLFPLASLAASLFSRIWDGGSDNEELLEANRLLSSLHQIARATPGILDVTGVATEALENVRQLIDPPAGLILLGEAGIYSSAASFGLATGEDHPTAEGDDNLRELLSDGVRSLETDRLPPALKSWLGEHPAWLVAPLRRSGIVAGAVIIAQPPGADERGSRLILQQIARETAIAIENARLFRQVRELSIDQERRRLARDLHDGVAQALTHARLELEFLAYHGVGSIEAASEEAARLSRVIDRAASEVRQMINGLSSIVSQEGLAVSLGSYIRDLRGLMTKEISFEVDGPIDLPPEVGSEVFRIAQEAVANSLHHSGFGDVKVVLQRES